MNLVASTGYYTRAILPLFFQFHGPGRQIDGPDPLIELFVGDIEVGIGGTGRSEPAMLKVVTDAAGMTPDVQRVMTAAADRASADRRTDHDALAPGLPERPGPAGVPSRPRRCTGPGHHRPLGRQRGPRVPARADGQRVDHRAWTDSAWSTCCPTTVVSGSCSPCCASAMPTEWSSRMTPRIFSHVTPPSWRAVAAPRWQMEEIPRRIIPMLRDGGASDSRPPPDAGAEPVGCSSRRDGRHRRADTVGDQRAEPARRGSP